MPFQKGHQINKGRIGYWGGKHLDKVTKNKISSSLKGKSKNAGRTPWNKGLEGLTSGFKGKTHTEDNKKLISINLSKARKGNFCGEKSPRWLGGISFEPYCSKFNERLKERIRDRDNRICQLCNEKENGKKLAVHHIHYDKPNCDPDLIALCNRCNAKVNSKREYHEDLFMNMLRERGII